MRQPITVETILATRGERLLRNGLITLRVQVPVYVWTEFLTHKRFARNASSSRAQKPDRHIDMGYYHPIAFYSDVGGMTVGNFIDEEKQQQAHAIWKDAWEYSVDAVRKLTALGVAREQANRLLPTIKMVRAIITGTESAWDNFLALRANPEADVAMQAFAYSVWDEIRSPRWVYAKEHIPFGPGVVSAVATIARVSYSGRSKTADHTLYQRLLTSGHFSPFEHVARLLDARDAKPSAVNSTPGDTAHGYAWQSYRTMLEYGEAW